MSFAEYGVGIQVWRAGGQLGAFDVLCLSQQRWRRLVASELPDMLSYYLVFSFGKTPLGMIFGVLLVYLGNNLFPGRSYGSWPLWQMGAGLVYVLQTENQLIVPKRNFLIQLHSLSRLLIYVWSLPNIGLQFDSVVTPGVQALPRGT